MQLVSRTPDRTETCSVVKMRKHASVVEHQENSPRNISSLYKVRGNMHLETKRWQMAWPQLFKSWIALSSGYITIQWISIKETNCAVQWLEIISIHWTAQLVSLILTHWIVIYPVDSAIQRLNNRAQVNRHLLLVSSCIIVCVRVASLDIFHDDSQYGRRCHSA